MPRKAPGTYFFTDDWYGGTRHMTPAEKGCYIDLLLWQSKHGWVPAEPDRMARICNCSVNELSACLPVLQDKFEDRGEGRLVNPKMESVRNWRAQQAEYGRQGASKRWSEQGGGGKGSPRGSPRGSPQGNGTGNACLPVPTPVLDSFPDHPKNDVVWGVVLSLRKALRGKQVTVAWLDSQLQTFWEIAWAGEIAKPGWLASLTTDDFRKVSKPVAWIEATLNRECQALGTTLSKLRSEAPPMEQPDANQTE